MREIDIYDKSTDPIGDVIRLGTIFARCGFFGCTKEEQGQFLAFVCASWKISPMDLLSDFDLVEDGKGGIKLAMKASAMLKRFLKRGGRFIWIETTKKIAKARVAKGENDREWEYTMEDAIQAGLSERKNYMKYPKQMLRARLISDSIRATDPEVNSGFYTPEELVNAPRVKQAVAVEVSEPDTEYITEVEPSAASIEAGELAQLEAILEPFTEVANKFFMERKLIQEGQNFRDLSPEERWKVINGREILVGKLTKILEEKANEVVTAEVEK